MTKLPWHWPIMKEVIRKHFALFLVLTILGGSFTTVGALGVLFADNITTKLLAALALILGLFVLGFNVVSNYSSCRYYYERALLKKDARSVIAIVTKKMVNGLLQNKPVHSIANKLSDATLSIQYQFTYLQKAYESESFVNTATLFDAIEVGMEVPVIVLKHQPSITRLQPIKLKRQLNLSNKKESAGTLKEPMISQSLIDD